MGSIDFLGLQRKILRSVQEGDRLRLTPEILGKIIVLASKRKNETLPSQDLFQFLCEEELPDDIARIVHFETRVDGLHLEEETQMVTAAQGAGILGRVNPETLQPLIKVSDDAASEMLSDYRNHFPAVVQWVEETLTRRFSRGD